MIEVFHNMDWKGFFGGVSIGSLVTYLINLKKLRLAEKSEERNLHERRLKHYTELSEIHSYIIYRKFMQKIDSNNIENLQKYDTTHLIQLPIIRLKDESKKLFGTDIKNFLEEFLETVMGYVFEEIRPIGCKNQKDRHKYIYNLDLQDKYKKYLDL